MEEPVSVMLPVPKSIVLVLALFVRKFLQVKVLLPNDNDPAVKVKALLIVKFAPNTKFNVEVFTIHCVVMAPAAVVQVPVPEFESKFTTSPEMGFKSVGTPPEVMANCVLPVADHVPVPPTQK
jgi:hypothetical protein